MADRPLYLLAEALAARTAPATLRDLQDALCSSLPLVGARSDDSLACYDTSAQSLLGHADVFVSLGHFVAQSGGRLHEAVLPLVLSAFRGVPGLLALGHAVAARALARQLCVELNVVYQRHALAEIPAVIGGVVSALADDADTLAAILLCLDFWVPAVEKLLGTASVRAALAAHLLRVTSKWGTVGAAQLQSEQGLANAVVQQWGPVRNESAAVSTVVGRCAVVLGPAATAREAASLLALLQRTLQQRGHREDLLLAINELAWLAPHSGDNASVLLQLESLLVEAGSQGVGSEFVDMYCKLAVDVLSRGSQGSLVVSSLTARAIRLRAEGQPASAALFALVTLCTQAPEAHAAVPALHALPLLLDLLAADQSAEDACKWLAQAGLCAGTEQAVASLCSAYRRHPKAACDALDVLGRRLPSHSPHRVQLVRAVLALFVDAASACRDGSALAALDLLQPACTALQRMAADEQTAVGPEQPRPLAQDLRLRRQLALVWLWCERLRVTSRTLKLALFVPPLVGLGRNYVLTLMTSILPSIAPGEAPDALYVRAVESLETHRATRGDLVPLLAYAVDEELHKSAVLPAVLAAGSRALEQLLTRYLPDKASEAGPAHHVQVARHAQAALHTVARAAHDASTRAFCFAMLSRLSARWPAVLYDRDVLKAFVALAQDTTLFLGDTPKEREDSKRDLDAALRQWVKAASSLAPNQCTALAQQCVVSAPDALLAAVAGSLDSQFVPSLERKSRLLGEISGLLNAASLLPGANGGVEAVRAGEARLAAVDGLQRSLLRELAGAKAAGDETAEQTTARLSAALMRSTAFAVTFAEAPSHELVEALCWTAARHVQCSSLVADAIFCWSWLLVGRPDLELELLAHLQQAWCWSADQGKGLFAASLTTAAALDGHRRWVAFLREQLRATRHTAAWNTAVSAMLLHALLPPRALLVAPEALGPRFELLQLCLSVNMADTASDVLLRERVVHAALTSFQCPPSWHKAASQAELAQLAHSLLLFAESVQREDGLDAPAAAAAAATAAHTASTAAAAAAPTELQPRTPNKRNLAAQTAMWSQIGTLKPAMPSNGSDGASSTLSSGPAPKSPRRDAAVAPKSPRRETAPTLAPPPKFAAALAGSGTLQMATQQQQQYFAGGSPKLRLIVLLLGSELDRLSVWNNPQNRPALRVHEQRWFTAKSVLATSGMTMQQFLDTAWSVHPAIAVHMGARFTSADVQQALSRLVLARTADVLAIPEAVKYLTTEHNVRNNVPQLRWLSHWQRCHSKDALRVLLKRYAAPPAVVRWAGSVLLQLPPRDVIHVLPQLVQALRWDQSGALMDFLAQAARSNVLIAHQVLWCTTAYTELSEDKSFVNRVVQLQLRVKLEMTDIGRRKWLEESGFFAGVTSISGVLQPLLGNENKIRRTLELELAKLQPHGHLYLPTNPDTRVVGIDAAGSAPMKSHAKVPVLVNFYVEDELYEHVVEREHAEEDAAAAAAAVAGAPAAPAAERGLEPAVEMVEVAVPAAVTGPPQPSAPDRVVRKQACIFKVGDDVRQDMLALQIMDYCQTVFTAHHVDVYLFPYRVIATHPNEGIIEVVPGTQSRDQLGKKSDGNLYQWFLSKYGAPNSPPFQQARENFVKSMAAYSLVSYILQVKDRHNGNILIDNDGHLIHIDFGFLFDISPGGDLNLCAARCQFERSPFKLTQEMVDIMGGTLHTEQFAWLMELSTMCFLAIREHMDEILTLVEMMLDTGFNCFKDNTIASLRARFVPDKDEREVSAGGGVGGGVRSHVSWQACDFFTRDVIFASWSKTSTVTTWFYDVFQAMQNQISY